MTFGRRGILPSGVGVASFCALATSKPHGRVFHRLTAEVGYHWHNTDIALMSCGDLKDHWFSGVGKVPLPVAMFDDLCTRGCRGDLSGTFLSATGDPIEPARYVRHGMTIEDLRAVARIGDGRASILVAGGDTPPDGEIAPQTPQIVLAALRSKAVSVWVTDHAYAIAVLELYAQHGS